MLELCIQVEHLTKRFQTQIAVNQLSFEVKKGEIFGILGHNGAGKTTTIEMLLGLQNPDEGKIRLLKKDGASIDKTIFERIGVQLQASSYQNNIRVRELCEEMASLYQDPADYHELLEQFELSPFAHHFVAHLSQGERQKLSILLALLPKPEMLFLDEATTGLDAAARRAVWDRLLLWKEKGTTILLTTHYMEEAAYLCDRILLLKQGNAIMEGTVADIAKGFASLEEAYLHYMEVTKL